MNQSESYRILKQCIDVHHVQKARDALDKLSLKKDPQEDKVIVHLVKGVKDLPPECRALLQEVRKAVPFDTYLPWKRYNASIVVYQDNELIGRGSPGSYYYAVCLEGSLGPENGMQKFVPNSHDVDDDAVVERMPTSEIRLQEGDILVWKGNTAFYSSKEGGGGRLMLIQLAPGQ